jgi:hypothetical protein
MNYEWAVDSRVEGKRMRAMRVITVFSALTMIIMGCLTTEEAEEVGYDDLGGKADGFGGGPGQASISVGDSFQLTERETVWANVTNSAHNAVLGLEGRCVIQEGSFVTVEGGDDRSSHVMHEYCRDARGTMCPTGAILEISRNDLESHFTRVSVPSVDSRFAEGDVLNVDAWLHETGRRGDDCTVNAGAIEIKRIFPHCGTALVVYDAPWLGGGGATACEDGAEGTVRLDRI